MKKMKSVFKRRKLFYYRIEIFFTPSKQTVTKSCNWNEVGLKDGEFQLKKSDIFWLGGSKETNLSSNSVHSVFYIRNIGKASASGFLKIS